MLPLIQEEVVENQEWLTEHEFIDLVAVAQSTPGPIAVNSATFIGQKTSGFFGGLVATAGVVTPSIILMFIIATFFFVFSQNKYVKEALAWIKPGTIGFIASAVWFIGVKTLVDWKSGLIFVGVLGYSFYKKPNPIFVTILTGIIGMLIY